MGGKVENAGKEGSVETKPNWEIRERKVSSAKKKVGGIFAAV